MSEIKQPQDHLKKQGPVTVNGIKLDIPVERVEDWEVLECLSEMQDEATNPSAKLGATVRIMKLLFEDDYGRIKTELRASNSGRLSVEDMSKFMAQVFEQFNPNS